MNNSYRRTVLALTVAVGLYVGLWAQFFPHGFYTSFPGFGLSWINLDGANNEHLIRDVGSLYLALTAISIAGIASRTVAIGRVAGLGWTVFGVLHFGYHISHMVGTSTDAAGTVLSLGISAILGILLLFPASKSTSIREHQQ
ncbi:hypothetical protein [Antricoccus suffuscus]|nr:hypothetical protein [Antricoccus suffuscus]